MEPVDALPSKVQSTWLPLPCSLQLLLPEGPVTTKLAARGTGVTVRLADCIVPPFNDPLIVTGVDAPTLVVDTVNGALGAPAAMATLAGTVATAVLLLVRFTVAPPDGALPDSVAVPCTEVPPTTLDPASEMDASVTAVGVGFGLLPPHRVLARPAVAIAAAISIEEMGLRAWSMTSLPRRLSEQSSSQLQRTIKEVEKSLFLGAMSAAAFSSTCALSVNPMPPVQ
jgi:hypothetical protein